MTTIRTKTLARWAFSAVLGLTAAATLAGCPTTNGQADYDAGYLVGFANDDYYWNGFDDSYDTVDGGPIYYAGADIPYINDLTYDAGYNDGLWYAYNDGYFVDYDYAFTIGFSEGYDAAFASDAIDFIQHDVHVEWADGGFTDGYNDGFSEGRVFGAYDYLHNLSFDWYNAMQDYRAGTDLTVGGVSTGADGPVDLYVYGTDPNPAKKILAAKRIAAGWSIRHTGAKASTVDQGKISYRPLISTVQTELNVTPTTTPRSSVTTLTLTSSWLDRVNQYRTDVNAAAKSVHTTRISD